jgi:molecular chaperone DnaK
MGYALGVDLGTTYTAAAVCRDGHAEIATLGNRAAAVPSVVLLREDETILTGDAANRRGATEPGRVAREFKRRVGDTTPIFLGGTPYSAETLMAKLLRWTVDEVAQREGGPPDRTVVSRPANWGQYKQDLLDQAIQMAGLENADTITEPEAAAIHYASTERIEPGDVVAVYDLGGGTFDAAVLRKTPSGFEVLGQPEGIERLGGIDFDAAVFAHVTRTLDGAIEALDEDDPTALAAVARLRQECVDAKEALSTDTDVSIPVMLPELKTEVRLTRTEFEGMVRPALVESIGAMRRALRSARVEPDQVKGVLLVGGSSRIPLVAQMVGAELGRPVAVDAHPKHSIALGASLAAAGVTDEKGVGGAAAAAGTAAAAAGAVTGLGVAAAAASEGGVPTEPVTGAGAGAPTQKIPTAAGAGGAGEPPPPGESERFFMDRDDGGPPDRGDGGGKSRRVGLLVAAAVLVAALLVGGGVLLASGGDGGDDPDSTTTTEEPTTTTEAPPQTTRGGGGTATTRPPNTTTATTSPPTTTTTPTTTAPPTTT